MPTVSILSSPTVGGAPASRPELRPRLAFRIGVSGSRRIAPEHEGAVVRETKAVLRFVRDRIEWAAREPEVGWAYERPDVPLLRALSSLADGADRMFAREAVAQGYLLEAVLPFARSEYERTFGLDDKERQRSIDEFGPLLAAADPRVLTLDGDRAHTPIRHRSYGAAGRAIVRNCDLLVAIWDGKEDRQGQGGTADTVHFAVRNGVPVWWIHAEDAAPSRFIRDDLELVAAGTSALADDGEVRLRAYIDGLLVPARCSSEEPEGLWNRVIHMLRYTLKLHHDPLAAYFAEHGRPNRGYWNLHPVLMGVLRNAGGRRTRHTAAPLSSASSNLARRLPRPWRIAHRNSASASSSPPAALSRLYRDRYRTSYVVILGCGAVALISAVMGVGIPATEGAATWLEFAALAGILLLVAANEVFDWHARYVNYRVLGELKRVATEPRRLGWSIAETRARGVAGSHERWVSWVFDAETRAVPLAEGILDAAHVAAIREEACDGWIASQIAFHAKRRDECEGAAAILSMLGRIFFFLTFTIVTVRMVLLATSVGELRLLSLCCAILPIVATGFFGIRAYEELEVLYEQSKRMIEALTIVQRRLRRIPAGGALASELVARELQRAASMMLSDVTDWAQLFRLRAVEA